MSASLASADALPYAVAPHTAPVWQRDYVVDLIKGFACLLMVLAHVPFPQAPWMSTVTLASVMFFSSTGMNLFGLAARRPGDEWRIAANGLFLIFAGFANNYVQGTLGQSDVFQSAGMAMIAMLLLRRVLPRLWTWLFPLPFLIHELNRHVFYWKVHDGGVSSFFITPGLFPLLPWLTFYLLGAHLKRYNSTRMRVAIWGSALATVGVLRLFRPFDFNKFWMSLDYWLLGVAVATLLLDLARAWERHWPRPPSESAWRRHERSGCPLPTVEAGPAAPPQAGRPEVALGQPAGRAGTPRIPLAEVRYWGANSLVFYILHTFVLRVLELWMVGSLAMFLLAVAITALLLRAGLALQEWSRCHNAVKVLAGVGAVAVAVLWAETFPAVHGSFYLRTLVSFGLTFGFVAAYPAWKNLTTHLNRPPDRPVAVPASRPATAV